MEGEEDTGVDALNFESFDFDLRIIGSGDVLADEDACAGGEDASADNAPRSSSSSSLPFASGIYVSDSSSSTTTFRFVRDPILSSKLLTDSRFLGIRSSSLSSSDNSL